MIKSVMQKGFLGRDTEQLFPYGIYTCVEWEGIIVGEWMALSVRGVLVNE